jgi:multidrug transporter EmrE-like cation transporter
MDKMIWVLATLGLSLYGQLIMKWRAGFHGVAVGDEGRVAYLVGMLFDPWVISGLGGAFLASVTYMLAIEKLGLAYAYPLMAISFVLVPLGAMVCFGERIPMLQVAGLALIVTGVTLSALSS